ncbi:MAG TPA: hypothetical protein PLN52_12575, partial [Opitutaceae bacterium]|nr:hypothetical protein [Opitutaceae bacterium]
MIRGRSESATHPHSLTAESVARLWLDAQGKVLAVNTTANQLWRIRDESLIGRSLVDLLAWEVISHESDWQSTQWDVLKTSATGTALPVQVQPFGGGDAVPVRLYLDPAHGDSPGYFATVVVEETTAPT